MISYEHKCVGLLRRRYCARDHRHVPTETLPWLRALALGGALHRVLLGLFLGASASYEGATGWSRLRDLGWFGHRRRCRYWCVRFRREAGRDPICLHRAGADRRRGVEAHYPRLASTSDVAIALTLGAVTQVSLLRSATCHNIGSRRTSPRLALCTWQLLPQLPSLPRSCRAQESLRYLALPKRNRWP